MHQKIWWCCDVWRYRIWHCDGRELMSSPPTLEALFDVCWQPRPEGLYPPPTVSPAVVSKSSVSASQQEGNSGFLKHALQGSCRICPADQLAKCCKRWLGQDSLSVLLDKMFGFTEFSEWCIFCVYCLFLSASLYPWGRVWPVLSIGVLGIGRILPSRSVVRCDRCMASCSVRCT